MTTILWHKGLLYADSLLVKGEERLQSLTKVHKLLEPIKMRSKTRRYFNDTVYGWVATGLNEAAEAFVELLAKEKDLDDVLLPYEVAAEVRLNNAWNHFEIILIGNKARYAFDFEAEGMKLKRYAETETVCVGSGCQIVIDEMKKGAVPLRAIYHAFYHQPDFTGGMIEVWKLLPYGKHRLQRLGFRDEVPRERLPKLLVDMKKPLGLDHVSNVFAEELSRLELIGKNDAVAEVKRERTRRHLGATPIWPAPELLMERHYFSTDPKPQGDPVHEQKADVCAVPDGADAGQDQRGGCAAGGARAEPARPDGQLPGPDGDGGQEAGRADRHGPAHPADDAGGCAPGDAAAPGAAQEDQGGDDGRAARPRSVTWVQPGAFDPALTCA